MYILVCIEREDGEPAAFGPFPTRGQAWAKLEEDLEEARGYGFDDCSGKHMVIEIVG